MQLGNDAFLSEAVNEAQAVVYVYVDPLQRIGDLLFIAQFFVSSK